MALHGDLSTLELADLFQNLERNTRTGLLSIESGRGEAQLYFTSGRLSLVHFEGRARLIDVLLASGHVDEAQLEAAKARRKGSRKSLGEMLVELELVENETLAAIARSRLLDDACELVASSHGAFVFDEGRIPRNVFDPEERRLGLELPAGPLLLEAARRSDHWEIIKNRIPSDRAHYIVKKPPCVEGLSNPELATSLAGLLDGTRSIAEVLVSWPHQRFEAYHLLSELIDGQNVRLAGADDLARIARGVADEDTDRAWELVERGLAAQPQNKGLLIERARLAELRGDLEEAREGLKLLAHLELDGGRPEEARELIERAKVLDATDPSLWEKSLALALDQARAEDARADGLHLVELYRSPGLHRKAEGVLERLVAAQPRSLELRRELARTHADLGDLEQAVGELETFGKDCLAREDYASAADALREVLALDPGRDEVRRTLEHIESGNLARRRARRRRILKAARVALSTTLVVTWFTYEALARMAYGQAQTTISNADLIEHGRYAEARAILADVNARFRVSSTAMLDVRRSMRELTAKLGRADGPRAQ